MKFSIALDDTLFQHFYNFKHGNFDDNFIIERLLSLYKPHHITNVNQLQRLGINDRPLLMQLTQTGLVNQTLEELTELTFYKILLSDKDASFPIVNVYNENLQNNYMITCQPEQDRANLADYLSSLFKGASNVMICDQYLTRNWTNSKKLFSLFPQKTLSLFFVHEIEQQQKTELKRICGSWQIKRNIDLSYQNLHDRYLLIDKTMEIIITSGIDYLFDKTKECTIICRRKTIT
jgi:hypothetical protein